MEPSDSEQTKVEAEIARSNDAAPWAVLCLAATGLILSTVEAAYGVAVLVLIALLEGGSIWEHRRRRTRAFWEDHRRRIAEEGEDEARRQRLNDQWP